MSESLRRRIAEQEERLATLHARGVILVDPRQVWVGDDVDLSRVGGGAVLHPGTRLSGPRLWLGAGSEVGREGPVTLVDTVLAEGARIDGGYARGAVLLEGASAGSAAHLRDGTLLEEQASTAHAVGLKQTILLSFVTLGSLINFCDCLMAGGTSRRDHSEVGSGYIHFNFTPWGARGDKATPSLIGDVTSGVFLRERRIFLGGSGGMVGPRQVDFGAVVAAGQVLRGDAAGDELLVQAPPREIRRVRKPGFLDRPEPRAARNVEYIGQLVALRCWYEAVRVPGARGTTRGPVIDAALENIDEAIDERLKRLRAFLVERDALDRYALPESHRELSADRTGCPVQPKGRVKDHVAWVKSLSDAEVEAGVAWLTQIADGAVARLRPDRA